MNERTKTIAGKGIERTGGTNGIGGLVGMENGSAPERPKLFGFAVLNLIGIRGTIEREEREALY